MSGEEIRRIVAADYNAAKILLESSRFFRVSAENESGETETFDAKGPSEAIGFFEIRRDSPGECFLDVAHEAVDFHGESFEPLAYGIADSSSERLRADVNYVTVQQFNRDFLSKLLAGTVRRFDEREQRIARKIVDELIGIDYPL